MVTLNNNRRTNFRRNDSRSFKTLDQSSTQIYQQTIILKEKSGRNNHNATKLMKNIIIAEKLYHRIKLFQMLSTLIIYRVLNEQEKFKMIHRQNNRDKSKDVINDTNN